MEKARNLLYYPSSSTISQPSKVNGETDYSRNGINASDENESFSSMTVDDSKSGGHSQDSASPIPSHLPCWGDPAIDGATEWLLKDMETYHLLVSNVEFIKSTGEYISGSIDNSQCWNKKHYEIFENSSLLSDHNLHAIGLLNAANIVPTIDDEGKKSKRRKTSSGAPDLSANGALEEHSTAAANGLIIDNGLDMDVSDSMSPAETFNLSQNSGNGEDGDEVECEGKGVEDDRDGDIDVPKKKRRVSKIKEMKVSLIETYYNSLLSHFQHRVCILLSLLLLLILSIVIISQCWKYF